MLLRLFSSFIKGICCSWTSSGGLVLQKESVAFPATLLYKNAPVWGQRLSLLSSKKRMNSFYISPKNLEIRWSIWRSDDQPGTDALWPPSSFTLGSDKYWRGRENMWSSHTPPEILFSQDCEQGFKIDICLVVGVGAWGKSWQKSWSTNIETIGIKYLRPLLYCL